MCILGCLVVNSQKKVEVKQKFQPYHRVTVGLLNAHVPKSVDQNGDSKWMLAGGWGLDYYYHFHRSMSFGIQLDMIMQQLRIKEHNSTADPTGFLVRSYPLSICPVITYQPLEHLSLQFGNGTEYCSQGTLFVSTFGIEYARELISNFQCGAAVTYSVKWNTYSTFMISFIFSKKLIKKKKP